MLLYSFQNLYINVFLVDCWPQRVLYANIVKHRTRGSVQTVSAVAFVNVGLD